MDANPRDLAILHGRYDGEYPRHSMLPPPGSDPHYALQLQAADVRALRADLRGCIKVYRNWHDNLTERDRCNRKMISARRRYRDAMADLTVARRRVKELDNE